MVDTLSSTAFNHVQPPLVYIYEQEVSSLPILLNFVQTDHVKDSGHLQAKCPTSYLLPRLLDGPFLGGRQSS